MCLTRTRSPVRSRAETSFFPVFFLQFGQKIVICVLNNFSLVQLAGELHAHAVSHLENVSSAGIEAMAQANTVAVLLPTTAYILRLQHPPARLMIERGIYSVM